MKMENLFDVRGLATVVTGGASGIGLAYSEVMADNGAAVTIMDMNEERLGRAVETLGSKGNVRGVVLEVTDRAAVRSAFDEAALHHGRIDVVFANAGIDGGPSFLSLDGKRNPDGAIENIADSHWDKVVAINLTSVFTTIQAATRHMKAQNGGRIIVTSSVAALGPVPVIGTPYIATKAATVLLVRQAALELAKYNILVNAILPGAFRTNIADQEFLEALGRMAPLHRLADTNEIQGAALFLA